MVTLRNVDTRHHDHLRHAAKTCAYVLTTSLWFAVIVNASGCIAAISSMSMQHAPREIFLLTPTVGQHLASSQSDQNTAIDETKKKFAYDSESNHLIVSTSEDVSLTTGKSYWSNWWTHFWLKISNKSNSSVVITLDSVELLVTAPSQYPSKEPSQQLPATFVPNYVSGGTGDGAWTTLREDSAPQQLTIAPKTEIELVISFPPMDIGSCELSILLGGQTSTHHGKMVIGFKEGAKVKSR